MIDESNAKNVEWLSQAHPTPWKARQRPIGARPSRGQFPWEVVDVNGSTVALMEYGQTAHILAHSANVAAAS